MPGRRPREGAALLVSCVEPWTGRGWNGIADQRGRHAEPLIQTANFRIEPLIQAVCKQIEQLILAAPEHGTTVQLVQIGR